MNYLFKASYVVFFSLILLVFTACNDDDVELEDWEIELEAARVATEQYLDITVAEAQGFFDASGFVPGMGHHYILPARIDGNFIVEEPEVLLYNDNGQGQMELVGIEYIVPIADINNPGTPPDGYSGTGDVWHLNTMRSQWDLHVWIYQNNPDGVFAQLNPTVTE